MIKAFWLETFRGKSLYFSFQINCLEIHCHDQYALHAAPLRYRGPSFRGNFLLIGTVR